MATGIEVREKECSVSGAKGVKQVKKRKGYRVTALTRLYSHG